MCKYCEEGKHMEEIKHDNIIFRIWGKHLQLTGKIFNIPFGREILINYCPICGRKLGD